MRRILSVGLIAFFLITAQGAAMTAFAADWELWPRGRGKAAPEGTPAPQQKEEEAKKPAAVPPLESTTQEAAAAAKEGKEGGKAVAAGISSGTIGKAVAITAGVIAIGIAVGGGGGGGTTTSHH